MKLYSPPPSPKAPQPLGRICHAQHSTVVCSFGPDRTVRPVTYENGLEVRDAKVRHDEEDTTPPCRHFVHTLQNVSVMSKREASGQQALVL